jgi:hypothetical protein
VCDRPLSRCRHARRRQTAAFCSNCWPQLIPKPITVLSTVQEHKVTTCCFMLRSVYKCAPFLHLNDFCTFTNVRCTEMGAACEELEVSTMYRGLHLRLKGQTSTKTRATPWKTSTLFTPSLHGMTKVNRCGRHCSCLSVPYRLRNPELMNGFWWNLM